MYILHTVQFLAVTFVVFRPVCSEQMVKNRTITEPVLNTTNRIENTSNATTIKPPLTVNNQPTILRRIGVQDIDTSGENHLNDTSVQQQIVQPQNATASSITTTNSSTVISSTTQKPTKNHRGREGVTDEPKTPLKNVTESSNVTQSSTELIPVNVTTPHEVVPKKGVTFNATVVTKHPENVTSTTVKPSTTTLKPKKPTVTIGGDQEDQPKNKSSSIGKVPTIEYFQQNSSKTNFVIPIVGVILSVPVVAIIINILYKRGKEWWSHRHYRRMDFLVDGMYNN